MLGPVRAYLVDGTYELFRAYYGGPQSQNATGQEVGAARTLLRSLLVLLQEPSVTHVACAFDHVIESFRNELFAGYKTGEGIEPELFAQFGLAERVSAALGILTWPMIDFEADDALATAADVCARDERVRQVLLCSPDKDLAQCVTGDRVVLLDRMREKVLDEDGVRGKFGVSPGSIPDYLALVGDAADGIPGIKGWGAKSAGALLARYFDLDRIPGACETWSVKVRGAEKLSLALNQNRDAARLYRVLATLRRDVPLGVRVDDLEWTGPHPEKLAELARELGDDKLVDRVERAVAARARAMAMPTRGRDLGSS
jgi:5'-3' exonuclease